MKIYLSVATNTISKSSLTPGTIQESGQELKLDTVRARLALPNQLELTLSSGAISDDIPNTENPNTEAAWSRLLHITGLPEITSEQSEQYLPEPLNSGLKWWH